MWLGELKVVVGGGASGSPIRISPLPISLPPVLASASQMSLKIPSATNTGPYFI